MTNIFKFNRVWGILLAVIIVALMASNGFLLWYNLGEDKIYKQTKQSVNTSDIRGGQFSLVASGAQGLPTFRWRSPQDQLLRSWTPWGLDANNGPIETAKYGATNFPYPS